MTVRRRNPSGNTSWAEDIKKEAIRWILPDYIPRRVVSSIYGPRNSGKTNMAVWLAINSAQGGCRVWMNSQEDDLRTVLKPRFDAAGYPGRAVRLTDEPWRLPGDLAKIRADLRTHQAGHKPDDMLILDSIQQHVTNPRLFAPAQATIKGLLDIASDYDLAVLLVGHTTKGKHASVEAMISGNPVLQNMSKAIYVFGPEPGSVSLKPAGDEDEDEDEGNPRYVLACERLGVAPKPVSMLFDLQLSHDPVTRRNEPFLYHLGPSEFTAREVIDAAKTDARGEQGVGKSDRAASWIKDTLTASGPMPTKDLEAQAKGDGVFGSRNTFDRARKLADVQSFRHGNAWWAALPGQQLPDE